MPPRTTRSPPAQAGARLRSTAQVPEGSGTGCDPPTAPAWRLERHAGVHVLSASSNVWAVGWTAEHQRRGDEASTLAPIVIHFNG